MKGVVRATPTQTLELDERQPRPAATRWLLLRLRCELSASLAGTGPAAPQTDT
jgi:hypothetical protein